MIDENAPNSGDPRLTAYALGELDETERAVFERELAADPRLREEIAAIEQMAEGATNALANEEPAGLTAEQQRSIAQAAQRRPRSWVRIAATIAALLFGSLLIVTAFLPSVIVGMGSAEPKDLLNATIDSPFFNDGADGDVRGRTENYVSRRPGHQQPPRLVFPPPAPQPTDLPHDDLPHHNTEAYDRIRSNPFVRTADQDTSTFSIDVDTAVPGQVVVVAVAVVFAVGLVVLVVVAHHVGDGESVVGSDEVDARVGLAAASVVQVAGAREALCELADHAALTLPVGPHGVAVFVVPLGPADGKIADLITP
jgi:hypothetical protein